MRARTRVLIGLAGATAWLLVLGFMLFAAAVMREPLDTEQRADGIVVLTGAEQRIMEGGRLLQQGRGRRLLISGVNKRTTREDVHRLSELPDPLFGCCVDLGYAALDTIGNARETRGWADGLGYRSLIVVTSRYHMPRSLALLRIAMPDMVLLPHPVQAKVQRPTAWWMHLGTTRLLIAEYLKFLPAAGRLAVSRLLGTGSETAPDAVGAGRPTASARPPLAEAK